MNHGWCQGFFSMEKNVVTNYVLKIPWSWMNIWERPFVVALGEPRNISIKYPLKSVIRAIDQTFSIIVSTSEATNRSKSKQLRAGEFCWLCCSSCAEMFLFLGYFRQQFPIRVILSPKHSIFSPSPCCFFEKERWHLKYYVSNVRQLYCLRFWAS